MKKALFILSCIMALNTAIGQQNHVNWSYEARKKMANTYDVIITANIEHPWHLYSQQGKGLARTSLVFKTNPLIEKTGKVSEMGRLEKVSDQSLGEILFYSGKVQFVQTVKVKGNLTTNLSGTIQYLVCDDNHCLPAQKESFDLKLQ